MNQKSAGRGRMSKTGILQKNGFMKKNIIFYEATNHAGVAEFAGQCTLSII